MRLQNVTDNDISRAFCFKTINENILVHTQKTRKTHKMTLSVTFQDPLKTFVTKLILLKPACTAVAEYRPFRAGLVQIILLIPTRLCVL